MRSLASQHFAAILDLETDGGEPLRLLTTPVYHYREMPAQVNDGVVFAFAQDTDPEVFLIIEARTDGNWYFAMAPSTSHGVEGQYKGETVLKVTRLARSGTRNHGTFMLRFWNDRIRLPDIRVMVLCSPGHTRNALTW